MHDSLFLENFEKGGFTAIFPKMEVRRSCRV